MFKYNIIMKILCLIPARSGSKGLPDKNIRMMVGKPLFAWSIEQAKDTEYWRGADMRIVVSTDSEKYKDIALKWGAEVPFLRPKELSEDNSTDLMFIKHALKWFDENAVRKMKMKMKMMMTRKMLKISEVCTIRIIKKN